jgi:hypothetical protein
MTAAQPINAAAPEAQAGFFINAGTHSGWFTTPDGDIYDIRKLEPREVTDPRSGEVTTIWGGTQPRARTTRHAMRCCRRSSRRQARGLRSCCSGSARHPALHHPAQPSRQGLHRHRLVLERQKPVHDPRPRSGRQERPALWRQCAGLEAARAPMLTRPVTPRNRMPMRPPGCHCPCPQNP